MRTILSTLVRTAVLFGVAGACALSPGAQRVRVTSDPNAVRGCKLLGPVHAEVDTFWMGTTETVLNELRAKAFTMGGDTLLLIGSITSVKKTQGTLLMGDGEAYLCSPAVEEQR